MVFEKTSQNEIIVMKQNFEITDKELITEMLNTAEYGVLALCGEKPYAVPVNFVYLVS